MTLQLEYTCTQKDTSEGLLLYSKTAEGRRARKKLLIFQFTLGVFFLVMVYFRIREDVAPRNRIWWLIAAAALLIFFMRRNS